MQENSKLSRKDREKMLRRQDILTAAAQLFSEKGFSNTTLEDIALRSEFGIGTIYNYFQSKEDIFGSIIDSIFEANMEILDESDRSTATLIDFLHVYTQKTFTYFNDHKEAMLVLVSLFTGTGERTVNIKPELIEQKRCRMDEKILNRIKRGIESYEIRMINPDNLNLLYHSILFPYITNLIKQRKLNELNINEHTAFVLDILFNGILLNKSVKD
ncbi:MAG: TetR/AcrR family transcriptional regulator [Ignavibacteria bacterium]